MSTETSWVSGKMARNLGVAGMQHRAKCEQYASCHQICFNSTLSVILPSHRWYTVMVMCHGGVTGFCLLPLLTGHQRKEPDPSPFTQSVPSMVILELEKRKPASLWVAVQ